MKQFWEWFRRWWGLLLVVLVGAGIRFYRLRELTTFGGDQGIDYLNVASMILEKNPTLLGPVTHVGIYLGPLYYYMLVPFMLLFKFDPIAAPVMFALFGTATVGLVYCLARQVVLPTFQESRPTWKEGSIFNFQFSTAALAALLYAVSPVIVESSRAPSQPHLIPFFSTLFLISIIQIIEGRDSKWDFVAVGVVLAATIQFHFLTFPLWIFTAAVLIKKGLSLVCTKDNPYKILWMVGPALVLLFPWFLFELRHQFFITGQIVKYLKSGEVSFSLLGVVERVLDLIWFSFDRLVGGGFQLVTALVLVLAMAGVVKSFKDYPWRPRIILLVGYVLVNVVGIALYIDPLANHYISALYPVVIVLTVVGIGRVLSRGLGRVVVIGLILLALFKNDPFRDHGYTMPEGVTTGTIQAAAEMIATDAARLGGKYNVANTLDGDTRANPYRYVLTAVWKLPPESVERYSEVDYLYIVSRNTLSELLLDDRWELKSFPVAGIDEIGQVGNGEIKVYRWRSGSSNREDLI